MRINACNNIEANYDISYIFKDQFNSLFSE
ncbi:hypothetical protein SHLI107390_14410 [Shewanella livingstonensis]